MVEDNNRAPGIPLDIRNVNSKVRAKQKNSTFGVRLSYASPPGRMELNSIRMVVCLG